MPYDDYYGDEGPQPPQIPNYGDDPSANQPPGIPPGAGGSNTPDPSVDPPPGGGSGGFDLSSLGSSAQALLKALGLVNGAGGVDMAGLLKLIGLTGGTLNNADAIQKAQEKLEDGANKANNFATNTIHTAQAGFDPYRKAGDAAVNTLGAQAPSTLHDNYKPIVPLSLGALAKRG